MQIYIRSRGTPGKTMYGKGHTFPYRELCHCTRGCLYSLSYYFLHLAPVKLCISQLLFIIIVETHMYMSHLFFSLCNVGLETSLTSLCLFSYDLYSS